MKQKEVDLLSEQLSKNHERLNKLLRGMVEKPEYKSAHKAGDVFEGDSKYEYAGEKRVPCGAEAFVGMGLYHGDIMFRGIHDPSDSFDNGCREILRPRQKARTTVTYWKPDYGIWHKTGIGFAKKTYTFKGLPDVDRVIQEMLVEEGALAVKIECSEKFMLDSIMWKNCYIWKKELKLKQSGWNNNHYKDYWKWYIDGGGPKLSDTDIESAISEYLKNQKQSFRVGQIVFASNLGGYQANLGKILELQGYFCTIEDVNGTRIIYEKSDIRPATPDEVDEWYTREVDGEPVRAYEDEDGDIILQRATDWNCLLLGSKEMALKVCKALNLPIMPYAESQGNYKPPKKEEVK